MDKSTQLSDKKNDNDYSALDSVKNNITIIIKQKWDNWTQMSLTPQLI